MDALVVEATLDTPTVGVVEKDFMLDGPLSWAAAMAAHARGEQIEPITNDFAPDFDLPLQKWHEGGTWGWCTSRGIYEPASYTTIEIRRRPATGEMSRFTVERSHHAALGPYKARDTTVPAAWIREIKWYVLCTDRDALTELLGTVTHLGRHAAIGLGHVTSWRVTPCGNRDAWRERPMPGGAQPRAFRAPYWHATRKVQPQ